MVISEQAGHLLSPYFAVVLVNLIFFQLLPCLYRELVVVNNYCSPF